MEKATYSFRDSLPSDADRRIRLNVTHLMLESARRRDQSRRPAEKS